VSVLPLAPPPGPAAPSPSPILREARLSDAPSIEALQAPWVEAGELLPRSRYDLCRHIREYHVAVAPDGGLIGCVALKLYSLDLAELAALAVQTEWQGRGVGRRLCEAAIAEARSLAVAEVFALTRQPLFFARLGFFPAERSHFPLKVWADCARCPRQDACDEVAVVLPLPA